MAICFTSGRKAQVLLGRRLGRSTDGLGAVGEREIIVASVGAVQFQGTGVPSWG